jgi:S-adenosylmethionine hydrolase
MSRPIVSLTTDFGLSDSYVGIMKGVILDICPEATLVDISHEIRPQAVRQAAYVLSTATPFFPQGTVHLVVVDPGVGSERRSIAVETEQALYVAPDNGVLDLVMAQDPARRAVNLTKTRYHLPQVSATFHGRDIFAPAAGHLASGIDLGEMGELLPVQDLVTLPTLQPQQQPDGSWLGEITHIDHFGNLITSFQGTPGKGRGTVETGGVEIDGVRRTFADVTSGELVAYIGSSGRLEIAVRDGNAAARLGVDIGDAVCIRGQA